MSVFLFDLIACCNKFCLKRNGNGVGSSLQHFSYMELYCEGVEWQITTLYFPSTPLFLDTIQSSILYNGNVI